MKTIKIKEMPATAETAICEEHGEFEFRYLDWLPGGKMVLDGCPKCDARAALAKEAEEAKAEEDRIRRCVISIKQSAGIGLRHVDASFDNYAASTPEQEKALKTAKAYSDEIAKGGSGCLVMCGKVGTGKTHLAAAILSYAMENRRDQYARFRIVKLSDLVRDVKATWGKEAKKSEREVMDYYSTVALLIIDEIGVQFGSETEKMFVTEIIDNRYQAMIPTVLISNLDSDGVKKCIGDRSYDRLREDGGRVIAFDWESHRGKKSAD